MAVTEVGAGPAATRVTDGYRTLLGRSVSPLGGSLGLLALLGVWWASTAAGLVSERLLPSPVAVATTLVDFAQNGFARATLVEHLGDSLLRWGLGVAAAVVLGVVLGVVMASSPVVDAVVTPVFEPLRYIPPLAWAPLALLWFGFGVQAQALVVFVAALPPALLNAHLAIKRADPRLVRASRTLGASPAQRLLLVTLPAGLPTIVAGVTIAFTNGWMALVGAELIGARSGLGFMIVRGQQNGDPSAVIACMVLIGVVGAALAGLLRLVTTRAMPWNQARNR